MAMTVVVTTIAWMEVVNKVVAAARGGEGGRWRLHGDGGDWMRLR